jgi:hypothetical protein
MAVYALLLSRNYALLGLGSTNLKFYSYPSCYIFLACKTIGHMTKIYTFYA